MAKNEIGIRPTRVRHDAARPLRRLLAAALCAAAASAAAARGPVDCAKQSLAEAVRKAADDDRTIVFTGICAGPIVIGTDGLTLKGIGTAVIDGNSRDAVTIAGAHGVSLQSLEVRNGRSGIVAINGAHVALTNVNVHDAAVHGITLQTGSSALLSEVTVGRNGLNGLDLQTGSAATVSGRFDTTGNRVFGINVNGSAITFSRATVTASANVLGIQVATNANAFLNDPTTVVNVQRNIATGLTVVSGAHLVSFGGTLNATDNRGTGVSVNSKGGLDLDAGSQLNSTGNGAEGLLVQENSVVTGFNNPQFSNVPGFSTLNLQRNGGSGLRLINGSTLTLSNQARLLSQQNGGHGLEADNGAGLTLVNSAIDGNGLVDLQLSFAARADISTSTFGGYACDRAVLTRGTVTLTCPH